MAETLSQSQIDDLLQKMRSGDVSEQESNKVKEYDFSSPKKFTKDQLKSLNTLYENLARVLAIYFTGILRNVCDIEVSEIEEQRYYEFNNGLPDSTLVAMISFEPEGMGCESSTLMLQLPTSLGYLLIDRLMGGSEKVYALDREYTEIELAILQSVLFNITKYIEESWSNFFPLKVELQSVEVNGRLLQAYSQQDVVVIVSLDIKEQSYEGSINVCMAAANLEGVMNSFGAKYTKRSKNHDLQKEEQKKNIVMSYLKESDLTVEAILDTCQMNLNDLVYLQPDDVIVLNKKITTDINIKVEGIDWCLGRIGEIDDKKAVKIVEVLER